MQNKHYFFFFLFGNPKFRGGGGVKPVGPKSQLLPKICFACFPYISQIKWQKIFDQVVKVVWHVCSIYLARQRSTQSFPAGRTILPNPSRFRYHPNVGPISFRFWIFRIFQYHWNIPICWSHAMLKLFNPWNVCLFHKAKVFLSSPTNRRVKPRLQEAV